MKLLNIVFLFMVGLAADVTEIVYPLPQLPIQEAIEPSLDGIYHTRSGTYTGVCVIRQTGQAYFLHYLSGHNDGEKMFSNQTLAVGVKVGDVLSVAWTQTANGKSSMGATHYKIRGRNLEGRWVIMPGGAVMTETLTYLGPLE